MNSLNKILFYNLIRCLLLFSCFQHLISLKQAETKQFCLAASSNFQQHKSFITSLTEHLTVNGLMNNSLDVGSRNIFTIIQTIDGKKPFQLVRNVDMTYTLIPSGLSIKELEAQNATIIYTGSMQAGSDQQSRIIHLSIKKSDNKIEHHEITIQTNVFTDFITQHQKEYRRYCKEKIQQNLSPWKQKLFQNLENILENDHLCLSFFPKMMHFLDSMRTYQESHQMNPRFFSDGRLSMSFLSIEKAKTGNVVRLVSKNASDKEEWSLFIPIGKWINLSDDQAIVRMQNKNNAPDLFQITRNPDESFNVQELSEDYHQGRGNYNPKTRKYSSTLRMAKRKSTILRELDREFPEIVAQIPLNIFINSAGLNLKKFEKHLDYRGLSIERYTCIQMSNGSFLLKDAETDWEIELSVKPGNKPFISESQLLETIEKLSMNQQIWTQRLKPFFNITQTKKTSFTRPSQLIREYTHFYSASDNSDLINIDHHVFMLNPAEVTINVQGKEQQNILIQGMRIVKSYPNFSAHPALFTTSIFLLKPDGNQIQIHLDSTNDREADELIFLKNILTSQLIQAWENAEEFMLPIGQGKQSTVYRYSPETVIIVPKKGISMEIPKRISHAGKVLQNTRRSLKVLEEQGNPGDNNTVFLMNYIPGKSLECWNGASISFFDQLEIAMELSENLEEIHERNLVHNDIKPANIMVDDKSGKKVITDYGQMMSTSDQDNDNYLMTGSPPYTNMNLCRKQQGDVYQMGWTLFETIHKDSSNYPGQGVYPISLSQQIIENSGRERLLGLWIAFRLEKFKNILTSNQTFKIFSDNFFDYIQLPELGAFRHKEKSLMIQLFKMQKKILDQFKNEIGSNIDNAPAVIDKLFEKYKYSQHHDVFMKYFEIQLKSQQIETAISQLEKSEEIAINKILSALGLKTNDSKIINDLLFSFKKFLKKENGFKKDPVECCKKIFNSTSNFLFNKDKCFQNLRTFFPDQTIYNEYIRWLKRNPDPSQIFHLVCRSINTGWGLQDHAAYQLENDFSSDFQHIFPNQFQSNVIEAFWDYFKTELNKTKKYNHKIKEKLLTFFKNNPLLLNAYVLYRNEEIDQNKLSLIFSEHTDKNIIPKLLEFLKNNWETFETCWKKAVHERLLSQIKTTLNFTTNNQWLIPEGWTDDFFRELQNLHNLKYFGSFHNKTALRTIIKNVFNKRRELPVKNAQTIIQRLTQNDPFHVSAEQVQEFLFEYFFLLSEKMINPDVEKIAGISDIKDLIAYLQYRYAKIQVEGMFKHYQDNPSHENLHALIEVTKKMISINSKDPEILSFLYVLKDIFKSKFQYARFRWIDISIQELEKYLKYYQKPMVWFMRQAHKKGWYRISGFFENKISNILRKSA